MTPSEEDTQVFIVRVWREPREIVGAEQPWRGVIEHVGSGRQRSIKALNEITTFMSTYLQGVAHEFAATSRPRQWLNPLRRMIHAWRTSRGRR